MKLLTVRDAVEADRKADAVSKMELHNAIIDAAAATLDATSKLLALTSSQLSGETDLTQYDAESVIPLTEWWLQQPLETTLKTSVARTIRQLFDRILYDHFARCEPRTSARVAPKVNTALALWGGAVVHCRTVGGFAPVSLVVPKHLWRESFQGLINGIDGVSMMPEEASTRLEIALRQRFNLALHISDEMEPWPATWTALIGPKNSIGLRSKPRYAVDLTPTELRFTASVHVRLVPNCPYATILF